MPGPVDIRPVILGVEARREQDGEPATDLVQFGRPIAAGDDPPLGGLVAPGEAVQQIDLARFVEEVRSIPADAIVVRQNWLRAYDFTTAAGAQSLNDYARANDPFAKVGKSQVAVDVSSVIRASPDSFRVAWTERRYQDGSLAETSRWTAILTVVVQPPRDAEALRKNPLGIYVNAINWSKEMGQ